MFGGGSAATTANVGGVRAGITAAPGTEDATGGPAISVRAGIQVALVRTSEAQPRIREKQEDRNGSFSASMGGRAQNCSCDEVYPE